LLILFKSINPLQDFDEPFGMPFNKLKVLSNVEGLRVLSAIEGLSRVADGA
jgi:hypothetical protein